ncbi:6-hydroxymethylpterin diphosphokinase MptE-like protein [Desulfovibrio inopinatus]|uniref:6-hydroxymethylpterin diphosphokinase MptE-like protein n=1 Tax=Desulfovibrio inopinatus TaxID=102109 RepID=UPI00146FB552|nr:6-hydroxymethylpterin diphosphokinase MptE-like protein [Desulfovibrio inopinatus]
MDRNGRLEIKLESNTLELFFGNEKIFSCRMTLKAIYSVINSIDAALLSQGIWFRVKEKDLRNPIAFELFMHIIMSNMVHYVFPQYHRVYPHRQNIRLQSIDSEISTIRNTEYINDMNHLYSLHNVLHGKPIFIVMPGPSLDMNFIREKRDSCILLVAGRAVEKIIQADIVPDIIYVQDINVEAWDQYFNMLGERKFDTILVANPMGAIYKYAKNFSRVFKAWNMYPFERDVFPKIDEISPSTSSGAYSTARLLGGNPIVFIGNDCGSNTPPRDGNGVESQTNFQFTQEGEYLLFDPTFYSRSIYMRFADEFSVITSNQYIAGIQWIKSKMMLSESTEPIHVYDISTTGLVRFNSKILDGNNIVYPSGVSMPPLPRYETDYDVVKFLNNKKRVYDFIEKHIAQGNTTASLFKRPFSCVLRGTNMSAYDAKELYDGDIALIQKNIAIVKEHIDTAISAIQGK